jgi:hypothetical protein
MVNPPCQYVSALVIPPCQNDSPPPSRCGPSRRSSVGLGAKGEVGMITVLRDDGGPLYLHEPAPRRAAKRLPLAPR